MATTATGLANTSADDCKISLQYVTDLELLREALALCLRYPGCKIKTMHIKRRIKQLEK